MPKQVREPNEGHRGSGTQPQVNMGGGACGKNGPVQMSTGCINVVRKNGRKEKGMTEEPKGSHFQKGSRRAIVKNNQKPKRIE
jgi:hypothetical protein